MLNLSSVGQLIDHFDLSDFLHQQVGTEVGGDLSRELLMRLWSLPLKRSHAVTRLGAYACRGPLALSIRLQFAQEEHHLRQTFLHEIAHFLDHQTRGDSRSYRSPHGRSWQRWLSLISCEVDNSESDAMKALYALKLKPVARCSRCGFVLQRLRCLPKKRSWLHRQCGGRLELLG